MPDPDRRIGISGGSGPNVTGQQGSGVPQANTQSPNNPFNQPLGPANSGSENLQDSGGRRVRLRPKPGGASQTYGSGGLLAPLQETRGLVFPYQPIITYTQEVSYQNMEMVHANQDFHVYARTPALKLQVDGEFTVQSQKEGVYALACLHFLRTVTKMYFAGAEATQGTPPPVLLFDAYGQYMFNSLPVVVTGFTMTLPKEVDYVPVKPLTGNGAPVANDAASQIGRINSTSIQAGDVNSSGYAWLPAHFTMTVNLTVQQTPRRLRAFDLDRFRTGELIRQGGWA